MLINILAIAVGIASLLLYLTAFVLPKLHRKDDFFWGSVGLFYALNIWVCRESFHGAILLGQLAVCAFLFSFIWQTWRLRVLTPEKQDFSLLDWIQGILYPKKQTLPIPVAQKVDPEVEETTVTEESIPSATIEEETEPKIEEQKPPVKKRFLTGLFQKKIKVPPVVKQEQDIQMPSVSNELVSIQTEETTEQELTIEEITETTPEEIIVAEVVETFPQEENIDSQIFETPIEEPQLEEITIQTSESLSSEEIIEPEIVESSSQEGKDSLEEQKNID